jgi:uncharacterized protein (TIGR01777 family)
VTPEGQGLRVLVSGASGLIGSALVPELRRHGRSVSALVRRAPGPGEIRWDPETGRLDPAELEGFDAVVHLAGENVGARWTAGRRRRIRESRIKGTRLLSEALAALRRPPRVLVSASAVGIYGNRGDEVLTEASSPGDPQDFLVSVGLDWEAAADPARAAGIRVAHTRFGIVLSPEGGALQRLLLPFRMGVGGRLGPGSQWMSWIGIPDVVAAVRHIIGADGPAGPVNVTAPEPVPNRELTRILGRVLGRPTVLPVPAWALRLVFGDMAEGTLLASTRVVPERLLASGYRFQHPRLEAALRSLLGKEHRSSFPA